MIYNPKNQTLISDLPLNSHRNHKTEYKSHKKLTLRFRRSDLSSPSPKILPKNGIVVMAKLKMNGEWKPTQKRNKNSEKQAKAGSLPYPRRRPPLFVAVRARRRRRRRRTMVERGENKERKWEVGLGLFAREGQPHRRRLAPPPSAVSGAGIWLEKRERSKLRGGGGEEMSGEREGSDVFLRKKRGRGAFGLLK